MPQKPQTNMKGTSPSKNIQRGVDTAWGAQTKGSTNPQQVLSQKHTKNPVKVGK
jgi:hypothetical protein